MSTQQRFTLRWKLCTSGTFEGESHPRLGDVGAAEMAAAIEAKVPRIDSSERIALLVSDMACTHPIAPPAHPFLCKAPLRAIRA
jgi:hypothetical protein